MRLLLASVLLPVLSHVARQAVACAADVPAETYTTFLLVYGVSLVAHTRWVDAHTTEGALAALVAFALTLAGSAWAHLTRHRALFVAAWGLHAIPSAALWPVAYRLVTTRTRSRTLLAMWSLQGNVGDALGCVSGLFSDPPNAPSVAATATALCASAGLLLGRRTPPADEEGEALVARAEDWPTLALATAASSCMKVLTYTASDWMPTLELDYMWYNAGGIAGTVLAGVVADAVPQTLERVMLFAIALALLALVFEWSVADAGMAIAFGVLSSAASTTLSISLCTRLAEASGRYGRTTALLDGGATLVAASVQTLAQTHFRSVQLVAAMGLVVATMALSARPH